MTYKTPPPCCEAEPPVWEAQLFLEKIPPGMRDVVPAVPSPRQHTALGRLATAPAPLPHPPLPLGKAHGNADKCESHLWGQSADPFPSQQTRSGPW